MADGEAAVGQFHGTVDDGVDAVLGEDTALQRRGQGTGVGVGDGGYRCFPGVWSRAMSPKPLVICRMLGSRVPKATLDPNMLHSPGTEQDQPASHQCGACEATRFHRTSLSSTPTPPPPGPGRVATDPDAAVHVVCGQTPIPLPKDHREGGKEWLEGGGRFATEYTREGKSSSSNRAPERFGGLRVLRGFRPNHMDGF